MQDRQHSPAASVQSTWASLMTVSASSVALFINIPYRRRLQYVVMTWITLKTYSMINLPEPTLSCRLQTEHGRQNSIEQLDTLMGLQRSLIRWKISIFYLFLLISLLLIVEFYHCLLRTFDYLIKIKNDAFYTRKDKRVCITDVHCLTEFAKERVGKKEERASQWTFLMCTFPYLCAYRKCHFFNFH